MKTPEEMALYEATRSPCEKRKVGAVIVNRHNKIIATGHNHSSNGKPCEDAQGATQSNVVHAEIAVIKKLPIRGISDLTMYVTHSPCANCTLAIAEAGIDKVIIVPTFMKFDTDKLRFDLIPSSWHEGDAEILTHGAKKYKPNNWKEADDLGRYIAALERHLNDFKKAMEKGCNEGLYDDDSGLHHMKHLRTNAGFLLTLTEDLEHED